MAPRPDAAGRRVGTPPATRHNLANTVRQPWVEVARIDESCNDLRLRRAGAICLPAGGLGRAVSVTAVARDFEPVTIAVRVAAGGRAEAALQFRRLAPQKQAIAVVGAAPSVLTPDARERIVVHFFAGGLMKASFSRADARDRLTGQPVPEAPRLIWDVVGHYERLPLGLRARRVRIRGPQTPWGRIQRRPGAGSARRPAAAV